MTAVNQNVIHWQGNSRQIVIGPVLTDLGHAINVRWWMARRATSRGTDIFVMKSLGAGITVQQLVGNEWQIIVQLNPDDTENVPPGNWYAECEVIDAFGHVTTECIGTFTVKPALIPADLDVL